MRATGQIIAPAWRECVPAAVDGRCGPRTTARGPARAYLCARRMRACGFACPLAEKDCSRTVAFGKVVAVTPRLGTTIRWSNTVPTGAVATANAPNAAP